MIVKFQGEDDKLHVEGYGSHAEESGSQAAEEKYHSEKHVKVGPLQHCVSQLCIKQNNIYIVNR